MKPTRLYSTQELVERDRIKEKTCTARLTFLSTGMKRALVAWPLPLVTVRSPSIRSDPQYCFSRQCRRIMPTTRPHGCFVPPPSSFCVLPVSSISGWAVNSGTKFSVGRLSGISRSPLSVTFWTSASRVHEKKRETPIPGSRIIPNTFQAATPTNWKPVELRPKRQLWTEHRQPPGGALGSRNIATYPVLNRLGRCQ